MNADPSVSRSDGIERDNAGDSDSDAGSDGIPDYYQPLSSLDGDGDGDSNGPNINGYRIAVDCNGHDYQAATENGVRSLNLSDDQEKESEEDGEEEEEYEERRRSAALRRALEEDESRRNAPLTEENAARVREAMRRVSFAGMAPDWTADVPEDRWLDQLHRLRETPQSTA